MSFQEQVNAKKQTNETFEKQRETYREKYAKYLLEELITSKAKNKTNHTFTFFSHRVYATDYNFKFNTQDDLTFFKTFLKIRRIF